MPGRAAFARADVADAKRGRPAGDLRDYAHGRGLDFLDRSACAGFRGAQPRFREYEFNVLRGVLPGGRFGLVFHELLTLRSDAEGRFDLPGEYHGVRTSSPASLRQALRPDASWLPWVGWLFNGRDHERDDEPFGVAGAWAPCTTVALRVPETTRALPSLQILPRSRTPGASGATTPPGGLRDGRVVAEAADGIAAFWSMDWFGYGTEVDAFLPAAVAAAESTGIAASYPPATAGRI